MDENKPTFPLVHAVMRSNAMTVVLRYSITHTNAHSLLLPLAPLFQAISLVGRGR